MKILYNNLKTTATTTVSSADTAFPVTNLNLLATTDEWRSATLTTSASVTMDLGSAKAVDFVGLTGNCYTRALPAATVLLEADTTNSFLTTVVGNNTSVGPAGSALSGSSVQIDASRVLVVHGNATEMRAIVMNPASLSATGSTVIHTGSVDNVFVAKLDATRYIVIYRDITAGNHLMARCITVSGTAVSAAAAYQFGTSCTVEPYLRVTCQGSQYAVVAFRAEATQYPTVLVLYYGGSNTVSSMGSRVTVQSAVSTTQSLAAHNSTDTFLAYTIDPWLRGSVITRSHVTLTANTPANLVGGANPVLMPTAATTTTYMLGHGDSTNYCSAIVTISGVGFSIGSVATTYAGAVTHMSMARLSATKFVGCYFNASNNNHGFVSITVSGGATSQSSRTEYSGYCLWTAASEVSETQVLFFIGIFNNPGARLLTFAAAFSQSLTVVPGEALAFSSFATKTYRYWRLTFSNPTGSYTGCSSIYLGQAFQFADNCFGTELTLGEADLSTVRFSNTGRRFIDAQSVRVKTLSLNLQALNKVEAAQWRDFSNFVGKRLPFFLMVDDSYLVLDTEQVLSGQFMLNDSLSISQTNFGYWSSDFTITEVI